MIATFFDDLRKGENIDLYVALLFAVALAITNPLLSIFGKQMQSEAVVPATMAVLSALTYVLLNNRRKLEGIDAKITEQATVEIERDFPPTYVQNLKNARLLLQIGVHLHTNLTSSLEDYRAILKRSKDSKLRFLVVDPNSAAIEMAAMRFHSGGKSMAATERTRAATSIELITALNKDFPGQVELRVMDYLFGYAGLLLETVDGKQIVYVERYTFRQSGGVKKPKFVHGREDPWYEFIRDEMETFWQAATKLPI